VQKWGPGLVGSMDYRAFRVMAVLPALVWGSALAGQRPDVRNIRGTVTDSAGRPIVYATVRTTGQSRTTTDDSGRFYYRAIQRGELSLRVLRMGYEPEIIRLSPAGDTTLRITLASIPRLLAANEISAARSSRRLAENGFYARMDQRQKGLGSGSFITQEDIEHQKPNRISAMLDAVPGVRVKRIGGSEVDWIIRGPNGCEYTLYLDGMRISPTGVKKNVFLIDHVLGPTATAGIEVYPGGAGAPMRYERVLGTCGVVIFWSR